jgi:hypothetical protein
VSDPSRYTGGVTAQSVAETITNTSPAIANGIISAPEFGSIIIKGPGACTDGVAGLAPLRMRSTLPAEIRNWSTRSGA